MNKAHSPINWENYPSEKTPINESNLNKMDRAIGIIDDRVIEQESKKLSKTDASLDIVNVEYNKDTSVFEFTKRNGEIVEVDVSSVVDSELSYTSTNPVQNKVVTKEMNRLSEEKADKLLYYSEIGNGGVINNGVNTQNDLWKMWNERLSFGMSPSVAPVPYRVNGQMYVDGTIMAHNKGNQKNNRWGFHIFEGYAKDNYSRMTMLVDKHLAETNGKPSLEYYYYIGANHHAKSYGNTKIGSDVAGHSFCFDRDIMTAYGEIDAKMPITLARISLSNDLNTTYKTVEEADNAFEPEDWYVENVKCLKYIALKNAENGAMFYDVDRNKPVMKINGKWCDVPFNIISDPLYSMFGQGEQSDIAWERGVIGSYGENVSNNARIRTVSYIPKNITKVEAGDGYIVAVVAVDFAGHIGSGAYWDGLSFNSSVVYLKSVDLKAIFEETPYQNVRIIVKREDESEIDIIESENILFETGDIEVAEWSNYVFASGRYGYNTQRLSTTNVIDASINQITVSDRYEFYIACFNDKNEYGGTYKQSTGEINTNATEYMKTLDVTNLKNKEFNRFVVVLRRTDGSKIDVSEAENVVFS